MGGVWLNDPANKAKLFAKTALSINCEHPSTIQTYVRPRYIGGDGRALVEHVYRAAVVRRRSVTTGIDRHRGEGVHNDSAFHSSRNRILVHRRATWDACIASRPEWRPASSSTTSTPIAKLPRRSVDRPAGDHTRLRQDRRRREQAPAEHVPATRRACAAPISQAPPSPRISSS